MNQKVAVADVGSPVRVPKTAELVASHLRRQIVRGELKEGDALPPESALMERFGVSRPTLREAFRVLESEALISVRRGARGGARVHTPDGDAAARYAGLVLQFRGTTLADVYEARRAIELAAVSRLAGGVPETRLKPLQQNLDEMDARLEDPLATIHLQEEFHRLLVEASGNQTLTIFEEMIHHIIDLHGETYVTAWTGTPKEKREAKAGAKTHHQLLDLIRARDGDGAVDLWARHCDQGSEPVLRGVDAKTVLDLLT
jgi:GntR family transcriptional regulator, transcriptional repressor for pyruvate dehydrogenase complex